MIAPCPLSFDSAFSSDKKMLLRSCIFSKKEVGVKEMFVNCNQALEIAKTKIKQTEAQRNLANASWNDSSLGQPVLVEDAFKAPSYWIVPLVIQEQVAGFVRIMGTGKVTAIGTFVEIRDS
ncbi:MAG: hypothetical protein K8R75_06760 [Deltaproteobacteria bacterium]|nr:hypothetical protein [Deltaproteobacteria bacterium]